MIKDIQKNLEINRRTTFIILFVTFVICVNKYNYFHYKIINIYFITFLILPLIIITLFFRESLKNYGLGIGNIKEGILLSGILSLLYIPCFILLLLDSSFKEYYSYPNYNLIQWIKLESIEFKRIFETEFFFRGFMLFGLKNYLGNWNSILFQIVPYSILHTGAPEIECYGSIPVGIALGYLSIRTNSIWYAVILHFSIGLLLDLTLNIF